MTDVIRGFEVPMPHNRRCEGCGIIVGPDSPIKMGYEVRDGEVTGFFHSRVCFAQTLEKYRKAKEDMLKGGE